MLDVDTRRSWDAIKTFWDPLYGHREGRFDWYADEFITGEDPNFIITAPTATSMSRPAPTWEAREV